MTTSIIIRADEALKERFEMQAKHQGLTMTFVLKNFMKMYAENPGIMRLEIDEDAIDRSWESPNATLSLKSLSKTLSAK